MFQGISTRGQYWMTLIWLFVAALVVGLLNIFLATSSGAGAMLSVLLSGGLGIYIFLSLLGLGFKRCRDIGCNPMFGILMIFPPVVLIFGFIPTGAAVSSN